MTRESPHLDQVVSALGFSNGCAELALKKPPPLVPSCLIASWRHRTLGDGLLAAFQVILGIGGQGLGPAATTHQRHHDRSGSST